MRAWQSVGGSFTTELGRDEALVLDRFAGELAQLLVAVRDGKADPADPAVRRLFPAAYADATDAAEFRALAQADLAAEKLSNQESIIVELASASPEFIDEAADRVRKRRGHEVQIVLDRANAEVWMRGLADIRVVLHERLDSEGFSDDEQTQLGALSEWLGFAQSTLVDALATSSR